MNELAILNPESQEQMWVAKNPETSDEQKALANAMANPTYKLSDYINCPIDVVNVFIEKSSVNQKQVIRDDEGNEIEQEVAVPAMRTILIDLDGHSYGTMAVGVINALKHFFLVYGTPDMWNEPLTVVPKNVQVGKGKMITLEVA